MSPPKSVEKMSPEEMRAELVSLLSDGVLRYLAKRKVDRGHRNAAHDAVGNSAFGIVARSSRAKIAIQSVSDLRSPRRLGLPT